MAGKLASNTVRFVAFWIILASASPTLLAAKDLQLEDFFGSYEGQAVSESGGEVSTRDIAVDLFEYKDGFRLKWATTTKRKDGRMKRKTYEVHFVPSSRDGVFASAMRRNLFGKAVPMDPLKGDPYVWATLDGATLTVYALLITEDHGYEMQTYKRTRTADGMRLVFHRVRDGERLRDVTGSLLKVD